MNGIKLEEGYEPQVFKYIENNTHSTQPSSQTDVKIETFCAINTYVESDVLPQVKTEETMTTSITSIHSATSASTTLYKKEWTELYDYILCQAVRRYGTKNWMKVSECFDNRIPVECKKRWKTLRSLEGPKTKPFSKQEDEIILSLYKEIGSKWSVIAEKLENRTENQVQFRYYKYLVERKSSCLGPFTAEEDAKLMELYAEMGPKWKCIASRMDGRSWCQVKDRFNSSMARKMVKIEDESDKLVRATLSELDSKLKEIWRQRE